jgi:hypothetical protein
MTICALGIDPEDRARSAAVVADQRLAKKAFDHPLIGPGLIVGRSVEREAARREARSWVHDSLHRLHESETTAAALRQTRCGERAWM